MPLAPPVVRLEHEEEAARFLHGGAVPAPPSLPEEGLAVVHGPDGRLLGVAEGRGGRLSPSVVLPPETG